MLNELIYLIKGNTLLEKAVKWILDNNKNSTGVYHDINHCFDVAYHVALLELSNDQLMLAALFHDFNHSAGSLKDSANIDLALTGYYEFKKSILEESDFKYDLVEDYIRCTEFPYVEPTEKMPYLKQLIREADMASLFKMTFIETGVLGLAKELKISIPEQLENQIEFVKNLTLYTDLKQLLDKEALLEGYAAFKKLYES